MLPAICQPVRKFRVTFLARDVDGVLAVVAFQGRIRAEFQEQFGQLAAAARPGFVDRPESLLLCRVGIGAGFEDRAHDVEVLRCDCGVNRLHLEGVPGGGVIIHRRRGRSSPHRDVRKGRQANRRNPSGAKADAWVDSRNNCVMRSRVRSAAASKRSSEPAASASALATSGFCNTPRPESATPLHRGALSSARFPRTSRDASSAFPPLIASNSSFAISQC